MAPGSSDAAGSDYADELELVAGVAAGNADACARFVRAKKERRVAEKAQAQHAPSVPAGAMLQTGFLESLPRPLDHYLDQLSEVQRTAVLLRFSIGHTIPEIAKITEAAIPTVKSRIQKGRDELRRLVRRDLGLGVRRGLETATGASPARNQENSSTRAAWAPPHVRASARC